MKKLCLLIDQDDVLAEYIKGVTAAYNKKYKTHFTTKDCITWDLYSVFGEKIETVMHEPELFRNLEPVKDAVDVFERLYNTGFFEMYIVTAANPRAVEAKCEWIKRYLPFFPLNRMIVCSCKGMIKGDYLLDDGMHNIEEFALAGGKPVIFEREHNKGVGRQYDRVNGWLEFEKYILKEHERF